MRIISVLIAIALLSTSATAAKNGGEKSSRAVKLPHSDKLLPEDYVFAGVDGKLIQTAPDKWAFEFESAANIGGVEIKAGQTLEMLGSATLEKMAADAKERTESMFRMWAKVTKFEGKNYLFAVYYLPLHKIDQPTGEAAKNEPNSATQVVNSPNDVVQIPAEIVALLRQSEVLPTTEAQATRAEELQLKQDTIFANKTGRVEIKNGGYVFEADALGRGVEKFTIKLLPCEKLEDAMTQVRSESNPVRFNVAGILTKYKGEQYLLLQKATRMYSYGNFGR
ncbi:MAG: hypothetical protein ABSG97_00440 [Sedimentisphaerales bacterium]